MVEKYHNNRKYDHRHKISRKNHNGNRK